MHLSAYAQAENVCAYVELTGARRCGSQPSRSNSTPSSPISTRARRRTGSSVYPSVSTWPSASNTPCGSVASSARARRSVYASTSSITPSTVSRPCRAVSAWMRRTPVAFAATWARRSPAVSCFERIWARSSVNTSSTIAPASTSLTGGMMTPSWNTSRNAPIDAGAPPPTSTWCARFAT